MTQKLQASATILVKNAQDTIEECLRSLACFDEIILLDNGSDDGTLEIARRFENVRIYQSEFIGFGALKNLAIGHAKHEWILSIDSDEVLEPDTLREIQALLSSPTLEPHHIFALPRKNLYQNEWIKACGWHPDFVWRLFNKTFTRFNDNLVHESIILPPNAKLTKLKSGIKHYAAPNMESIITKMNRYTTFSAQEKHKSGKRASMLGAIARFWLTFFKDYLLRGGFRYGYKGFVIALLNANGAFFRYAKLYELQSKKQERE